ncbi:MAG: ClbS/DfsB family four-helix bundle protein [Anaerolineae bacterium]|nr:ClbS/DfsB family four-helix bundle protein [Anaerolineae bacterium]
MSARLTGAAGVLLVVDVVKAANYYRDQLGFHYDRFYGHPANFVILRRDGFSVMLSQAADAAQVVPHWQVVDKMWNLYFWVDDVEALYQEMIEHGAIIDYELGFKSYGIREFGVQDLDGHDIAFGQLIDEAPMTKGMLLDTLRSKRAQWDGFVAGIPKDRMTEAGAAGKWSVKDVIAHLTYHERWIADRLHEQPRGEGYAPKEIDAMSDDARNEVIYQRERDRPLQEILADSQAAFARLMEGVEGHTEAFLTEPHEFEGAPEPIIVWQFLRDNVYDHYSLHMPSIRHWLRGQSESA